MKQRIKDWWLELRIELAYRRLRYTCGPTDLHRLIVLLNERSPEQRKRDKARTAKARAE